MAREALNLSGLSKDAPCFSGGFGATARLVVPAGRALPVSLGLGICSFFFHAWCHRDQVLPEQKRSVRKACPSTPSVSDCPCSPLDSLMHTALGPICPSFPPPLSTAVFFAQSLHLSSIHLPLWEGGWCWCRSQEDLGLNPVSSTS